MDLNNILEIGILYNAKIENTLTKELDERNLLVFIFSDNSTHYLDIDAGKELTTNERVLVNKKTKVNKIYTSQKIHLDDFQKNHPTLNIKVENGILKANKKRGDKKDEY